MTALPTLSETLNSSRPAAAVTLLAALALAAPAVAQQADGAEAGADTELNLEMGTPVDESSSSSEDRLGAPYILELSGDWEVRCINTQLEHDPCALHQVLLDEAGNSVATVELVNLPAGSEAAAGATIVTPLETLLTAQLTLSIDGGGSRRYPFTFCTQQGCVSRVGFTAEDVNAFRRGNVAGLTIVPALAPDQQVNLQASLSGFTAGYARIEELNTLNQQAIAEARAAAEQQQSESTE